MGIMSLRLIGLRREQQKDLKKTKDQEREDAEKAKAFDFEALAKAEKAKEQEREDTEKAKSQECEAITEPEKAKTESEPGKNKSYQ